MSEAMRVFNLVLDNSQDISKQINQNVYDILGINTQDKYLSEFIMSELNNFDFNRVETELINRIRQTVDDALKPLVNPNENNYEAILNNLINNLKLLKIQDYMLDSNFRNLSSKISSKFPLTGITQEQFYSHFMSKTEKIKGMISKYNNELIDSLIRFSPQLINELQQSRVKQQVNAEQDILNAENIRKTIEPTNSTNIGNQSSVPNDYRRGESNPNIPNPTPSASTYIGATNEDVKKLIKSNEYYSLLHGIKRESFMKFNGFIQTGFNLIINDYYNRVSSYNTLDERLQAFAELKEIYQNFEGYVTMEQSNQLREQIEKMSKFLQKMQSQELVDDIGIRYNSSTREETKSVGHM